MKIMATSGNGLFETTQEVAAQIQFGLAMNMNFTFDNFVIFKHYNSEKVVNTIVQESKVDFGGINDEMMTEFVTTLCDSYNTAHVDGIDMKKNQIVGFVAGLLRHTLLTPFVVDEYLYGGFSWITDGV